MINWTKILTTPTRVDLFKSFANGSLAKNDLLSVLAYSDISGTIRNVIHSRGTDRVRVATRKALQRRNLV